MARRIRLGRWTPDRIALAVTMFLVGFGVGYMAHSERLADPADTHPAGDPPVGAPPQVAEESADQAVTEEQGYRITRLSDGDSFEVAAGDLPIRVRLFGIDCPEMDQPFGREARGILERLVDDRPIRLEPVDRDRYGRMVAVAFTEDGRNINHELVRQGAAWQYRQYDDSEEVAQMERDARQAGRGLWAEPNPVPPWDWRRGTR